MAAGALTGIMPERRVDGVAGYAVIVAGVVEADPVPVVGDVAQGALAGIVRLLQRMALLAIGEAGVVKPGLFPVVAVVASRALPLVMVFRVVLLQVALLTVEQAGVIKRDLVPVGRASVAIHTRGRKAPLRHMPLLLRYRALG